MDEAIRQSFQERHQIVFLGARQTEFANGHIFVVRVFRRRPAVHFLHRSRATLSVDECSRIGVARVVEVDDFLEAQQIAVVHVRLDETGVRHFAHVAGCGGLELAFEERQVFSPGQIWRGSVVAIQEKTNSLVDEAYAQGVAGEAPLIREAFRIPWEDRVLRQAEIVVGKVGEHRFDARRSTGVGSSHGRVGSAVEVAGIACAFAAEKLIATQFLRGEGIAAGKIPVKFRCKRTDIGSDFIGGNGLGEFVEGLLGTSAIRRAESQGSGAAAETGGAFRSVAYPGHIGGPVNLEGACAPDLLEEEFVLAERQLIDDAGSIRIGHLLGIDGWVLGLFRGRVLQAVAASASIPEIAAVEIALGDVVLQRGGSTVNTHSSSDCVWPCDCRGIFRDL